MGAGPTQPPSQQELQSEHGWIIQSFYDKMVAGPRGVRPEERQDEWHLDALRNAIKTANFVN